MRILYVSKYWNVHNKRIVEMLSQIQGISLTTYFVESSSLAAHQDFDIVHFGPTDIDIASLCDERKITYKKILCMPWVKEILYDSPKNPSIFEKCKKGLEYSDAFWFDCQFVENYIFDNIIEKKMPSIILPWGIDLGSWQSFSSQADSQQVVFTSMRAWEEAYNIPTLLHAFKQFTHSDKHENTRLILANTGSLKKEVFAIIKDLNLEEKVSCPGPLNPDGIKEIYRQTHIYISSSLSDGSSISLLEAMAAGLPIIAHSGSGNGDWITKENGILVNFHSPSLVAEAMEQVIHARSEWKSMGIASQNLVRKKADWSRASSALERFYRLLN